MAKRKRKKKKAPGIFSRSFGFVVSLFVDERFHGLRKLTIVGVPFALLLVGMVMGMSKLEGYVKGVAAERNIPLQLAFVGEKPNWVTDSLLEQINLSCAVKSDDFLLDDDLVKKAWVSLQSNPWVESVNHVRKCYSGVIEIDYKLREPIAEVVRGNDIRFLDANGVVMDYAPIQRHLIRIEGSYQAVPMPGLAIKQLDVLAALTILDKIKIIDNSLKSSSDRIWSELAYIDISNYEGRVDNSKSHINLFTHKNTEIRWGADINNSTKEYEADQRNKLLKLYCCYRDYGTLDISSAGIELRDHLR